METPKVKETGIFGILASVLKSCQGSEVRELIVINKDNYLEFYIRIDTQLRFSRLIIESSYDEELFLISRIRLIFEEGYC